MNTCKYCGKPLTLTPEFDTCMECQGRIMRETIYGNNGGFATNSTKSSMNIYDEAKVITHEEARQLAFDMLPKQVGSKSSQNKVNKYFGLDLYFRQQEVKEERAKKVEELLELYKSVHGVVQSWDTMPDVQSKINKLEKELEELK